MQNRIGRDNSTQRAQWSIKYKLRWPSLIPAAFCVGFVCACVRIAGRSHEFFIARALKASLSAENELWRSDVDCEKALAKNGAIYTIPIVRAAKKKKLQANMNHHFCWFFTFVFNCWPL